MVEIISMILGLVLIILKDREPKQERSYDADMQAIDKAIGSLDGPAVAVLFERLRRESGSHSAGQDGNAFIG